MSIMVRSTALVLGVFTLYAISEAKRIHDFYKTWPNMILKAKPHSSDKHQHNLIESFK